MKQFTIDDVKPHGNVPNAGVIYSESTNDFIHSPLKWQRAGLSETKSGYGAKTTSYYKIHFCGRLYRLYNTCFSNASSTWFKTKGKVIFVH